MLHDKYFHYFTISYLDHTIFTLDCLYLGESGKDFLDFILKLCADDRKASELDQESLAVTGRALIFNSQTFPSMFTYLGID